MMIKGIWAYKRKNSDKMVIECLTKEKGNIQIEISFTQATNLSKDIERSIKNYTRKVEKLKE